MNKAVGWFVQRAGAIATVREWVAAATR